MFLFFYFLVSLFSANAQEPEYQVINIYTDISEVYAPDGTRGTSIQLNTLISHYAQMSELLEHQMNKHTGHKTWQGEINVWDWSNVKYMPGFKSCNYLDSIKCAIQNKHWVLKTVVSVGDKYSVFTQKLYNEKGMVIAQSSQTAWGTIRWKPRWKLTKIKEQGPFGGGTKEIFEMWPPKMEELPPLIKPFHVAQSRFGVYAVEKRACRLKVCNR
jgi:hypothetical protein